MYTFTISARDIFFSEYEMKKIEMTFKNDKGIECEYLIESVEIDGLLGVAPYADLFVFGNLSPDECLRLTAICEKNSWNYDMFES